MGRKQIAVATRIELIVATVLRCRLDTTLGRVLFCVHRRGVSLLGDLLLGDTRFFLF
jgi:hypothetical protein